MCQQVAVANRHDRVIRLKRQNQSVVVIIVKLDHLLMEYLIHSLELVRFKRLLFLFPNRLLPQITLLLELLRQVCFHEAISIFESFEVTLLISDFEDVVGAG